MDDQVNCSLQFPLVRMLVEASNGVRGHVGTCVSWRVRLSNDVPKVVIRWLPLLMFTIIHVVHCW